MSKICTKCGEEKLLEEFLSDKRNKDGKQSCCICCNKKYTKNHAIEISIRRKIRDKNNRKELSARQKECRKKCPWKNTFGHIKDRCRNPNHKFFKHYGGRDIKCLITVDELKQLWFRDKAYLMNRPTIDKKDNNGNYTFKNCRYIENVENCSKNKRKPVNQYDLSGKFIKTWNSAAEIERELGYNNSGISKVCLGQQKTTNGFIWRFKNG